ncbi:MAG: hypothetical protein ABW022_20800 [Actinoplanes sp.]
MSATAIHCTLTGHILAAIDRAGKQAGPVPVDRLVGAALPVRRGAGTGDTGPVEVAVPVDQLGTAGVDSVPDLLTNPFQYAVSGGHTLTPLSPWGAEAAPTMLTTTSVTVTLERTSRGVATPVLVVLAGPDGVLTLSGQVFSGRKAVTIGVGLRPGQSYAVLTLAAGWQARADLLPVEAPE